MLIRLIVSGKFNPRAHSLFFKKVSDHESIYSIRISHGYRALGLLEDDAVIWFWVGSHDEVERLLKQF